MTIPTEGYDKGQTTVNRARDPREHEKIFEKLNKLNMQACELIDRLHGKYESLKEGAQTKTGTQIYNLVVAYENFIDEMNIIEMDQNIIEVKSRLDEFTTFQEKLRMRIADRFVRKPVMGASGGSGQGEIVRGMGGAGGGGNFDHL